jgi:hypothetical protein
MKSIALSLVFALGSAVPVFAQQMLRAGHGSITLSVTPQIDEFAFGKDRVLLQAVSSDGSELYEIHQDAGDLLALRQFRKCLRSSARIPHDFQNGKPSVIKMSWDGASTQISIDGGDSAIFDLSQIDEFGKMSPFVNTTQDPAFTFDGVTFADSSDAAESGRDAAFVQLTPCPDRAGLFKTAPQEKFRGIALQNFPDEKSRAIVKKYIALLPDAVAAAIGRVIMVESNRYAAAMWRGQADFPHKAILLQQDSLRDPAVFFHESAHMFDYAGKIKNGVWFSEKWKKQFTDKEKNPAPAAMADATVLGVFDASSAAEELADFTGNSYAAYLDHHPFRIEGADEKLAFIMRSGFMNRDIYVKINRGGQ